MFQRWLYKFSLRIRSILQRRRVEEELNDELRFHLERQTEDHVARGLSPEEARRRSLLVMNGIERQKEECRDARGIGFIENLTRDIRYAFRGFLKNPGFTGAVLLTLALGIGANAAVFTVVNSVLLRQLPYTNAERLVWIWSTRTDRDKAFYSIQNFIDTRSQAETLADMAAYANWGVNLTGSGEAERLAGVRVTPNTFEMLGVNAVAGRTLVPSDGRPDAGRMVMISNGLWRRRFGEDSKIVGRSLLLNGIPYVIAGVLPAGFILPNAEVEVASPLVFETDPQRTDRGSNFLRAYALLKPGVSPKQTQAELSAITDRLKRQFPEENAKHTAPRVLPMLNEIAGSYSVLLWTLMAAVVIVLLIGCTNLANMMVIRSSARQREFAIRTALGGTRSRFLRELTTASLLLAGIGGLLGLQLASWGVRLLVSLGPADLPRATEIGLDWRVLAFTLCMSVVVGIVFGLTPALQAGRADLNEALKSSSRSQGEKAPRTHVRRVLVVCEVALSLLLLVNAGLLVRSFMNLQAVDTGVDTRNLLSVRISLPATRYSQPETLTAFFDRLVRGVKQTPGVRSVSVGSILPLSGMNTRSDFSITGRPPMKEEERPAAQNRWIAPEYFRTMGIPVQQGREFNDLDTGRSQPVAIIDEALARRHFPNENPIGKSLRVTDSGPTPREIEIVGVVGNVKHFNLDDPATPTYYSPLAQTPPQALGFLINGVSLVVRTEAEPLSLVESVRREIQSVDKDVPASAVRTMDQFLAASVAPRRFNLLLIELFALAALILSAMGLYSVIAYTVAQNTREIGIRMALGASARDVFAEILREGLRLMVLGEAVGLVAALLTTRLVSGLLFGVQPTDPATFVFISLTIAAAAFLACYVPARRATRLDPTIALRQD